MFWRKKKSEPIVEVTVTDDGTEELGIGQINIHFQEIKPGAQLAQAGTPAEYATPKHTSEDLMKQVAAEGLSPFLPTELQKVSYEIGECIYKGLNEGLTSQEVCQLLADIIPDRQTCINVVATESVYITSQADYRYGLESGAVGKEWQYMGPAKRYNRITKTYDVQDVDVCCLNAQHGPVRLNETFKSGHLAAPAHLNCRCAIRLIYPEELEYDKEMKRIFG